MCKVGSLREDKSMTEIWLFAYPWPPQIRFCHDEFITHFHEYGNCGAYEETRM